MCKYRELRFYIPIDVVRNIDHAHGDVVVMGDDEGDDAGCPQVQVLLTIRHLKKAMGV